ncbi:olfactory receptor 1G1-like [Pelobates fuscus]|uniref:olfactory receptor 1G1-like n=1 Tax=Pelobates fuscus TaxID=191477 RepID=UPI002FE4E75C
MNDCKNSSENEFYILAFSASASIETVQFLGILFMYLVAVLGNMIIVGLVISVSQLHTPMYFFLCNLSVVDITYVSNTLPMLLSITLTHDHRISYQGCITQTYFYLFCTATEIFILTSMAYDRYVAICIPLQYPMIMNKQVCIAIATCSWLISLLNSLLLIVLTSMLSFCYFHEINHFFCELKALLSITSTDTSSREILLIFEDIFIAFLPFLLTIISYGYIVSTILKVQSSNGRLRAFSRCTSHFTTVLLFYGPGISLYLKPHSDNFQEQNKVFTMLYVAVVPMLNPLVYSLRNNEVMGAIKKLTNVYRNII